MSNPIRRRDLIALAAGAAALPFAARAQQRAVPVIGYLSAANEDAQVAQLDAFRSGLGEVGYIEGRNVEISYRWAGTRYVLLAGMAIDLVSQQPAVILATGAEPAALAAKSATTTIPIVFVVGADPVELGLVARLNRPGGNLQSADQSVGRGIRPQRASVQMQSVLDRPAPKAPQQWVTRCNSSRHKHIDRRSRISDSRVCKAGRCSEAPDRPPSL